MEFAGESPAPRRVPAIIIAITSNRERNKMTKTRARVVIFACTLSIVRFTRTMARKAKAYQLYAVSDVESISRGN